MAEQAAQPADGKVWIVLLCYGHEILRPRDLAEVAAELRRFHAADDFVRALDA